MPHQTDERYLRLPAVLERVPVSRTTLYRWIREDRFPPPYRIGPNTAAWAESEVLQALQELASEAA